MGKSRAPGASEVPDGTADQLSTADLIRAALLPEAGHLYLSTACLHRNCRDCRQTCKFCVSSCICDCHSQPAKKRGKLR